LSQIAIIAAPMEARILGNGRIGRRIGSLDRTAAVIKYSQAPARVRRTPQPQNTLKRAWRRKWDSLPVSKDSRKTLQNKDSSEGPVEICDHRSGNGRLLAATPSEAANRKSALLSALLPSRLGGAGSADTAAAKRQIVELVRSWSRCRKRIPKSVAIVVSAGLCIGIQLKGVFHQRLTSQLRKHRPLFVQVLEDREDRAMGYLGP
jgi:hypothetical protein